MAGKVSYKRSSGSSFAPPPMQYFKEESRYMRDLYSSALKRFQEKVTQARTDFGKAEKPIQETVESFRPGGGYGAGQHAIIEREAREALGAGQASLVQTGMASGSTMAGLHGLVKARATEQTLGVEDVRTENLSNALMALSNLRASAAGALLTAQEPGMESIAGFEASRMGSIAGQATGRIGAAAQVETANISARAALQRSMLDKVPGPTIPMGPYSNVQAAQTASSQAITNWQGLAL